MLLLCDRGNLFVNFALAFRKFLQRGFQALRHRRALSAIALRAHLHDNVGSLHVPEFDPAQPLKPVFGQPERGAAVVIFSRPQRARYNHGSVFGLVKRSDLFDVVEDRASYLFKLRPTQAALHELLAGFVDILIRPQAHRGQARVLAKPRVLVHLFVSAGAPDFLQVILKHGRRRKMHDVMDVRNIHAHAKGLGGAEDIDGIVL